MSRLLARWSARLRGATFRRQLTLAVAGGVLGVAAVSAVLSSWQGSLQVRETLVRQGLNLATSLAQQSQLALLTEGADNAREPVERALSFPDVLRVELLRPDGRALLARGAAAPAAAVPPMAGALEPYLEAETSAAWTFVAPVRMQPGEASPFEAPAAQAELLGFVRVTQGKAALVQLVGRLVAINFGVGLALSALLLWALRQLARRLTRPLGELAAVMAHAGEGRLGLRAQVEGPRDIANMAQVFNGMMHGLELREQELQQKNEELARHALTLEERVEERTRSLSSANRELQQALDTLRDTQRQLIEAEKLASLGRLVAGVAHELNTPLGNALMAASTMQAEQTQLSEAMHAGQLRKSEFDRMLSKTIEGNTLVMSNVRRAADIIRDFKQLALDQTTDMRRSFLAHEVIGELLATLQPMFRHSPYELAVELEPGLRMDSYPGPLGQVVSNVVQNALLHGFAGRDQGRVTVQCHALGDDRVQIICSDDGEGMTEAVRLRVFEAFFTTKLGQGGSGLGMQIVHSLVTGLLGGRVQVESEPGAGTRVLISLPRQAPQAPQPGPSDEGATVLDSPPGA
ncbi:MAG: HAMP domain-containing histidine kinase [Burkholderiaceae bacterium]|nr:HAMP domain-containing histidine kinase [Burkholderiaceae bacterium]